MRNTDIAIVGGGLAGSTAAAMLARAGRDFALIDPDETYPPDFRCEKLEPTQLALLRKTGLSDAVVPSITSVNEVWAVRLGRFVHKYSTEQSGFHYSSLVNRLRGAIPAAHFVQGKVASIETSNDRQVLTLSKGERISARLIVLATGLNNALRKSLGVEREIMSANHSITLGFDIAPVGRPKFDFPALTYFPERPSNPIAYLTLFPVAPAMRANLFVYLDVRDPWLQQLRAAPVATMLAAMPGLRRFLGDFEVLGEVKLRPADLYATKNHEQAGIVLVGDAFATSCPAAGTGATKVFMDVERLCNVYIPRWLASEGMGREKIAAFYADPEKRACDAQSEASARYWRSLSIDPSIPWRLRRLVKRARGLGRGFVELAKSPIRSMATAGKLRVPRASGASETPTAPGH